MKFINDLCQNKNNIIYIFLDYIYYGSFLVIMVIMVIIVKLLLLIITHVVVRTRLVHHVILEVTNQNQEFYLGLVWAVEEEEQ
jgi:hypothetical protein